MRRAGVFHCGLAILALLLVASCAGPSIRARNPSYSSTTGQRLDQVADQPLADLDLSKTDIPPALVKVAADPYAPPARPDCAGLKAEIDSLSILLGPDIGPLRVNRDGNILSDARVENSVENSAFNTARGAAEGWIPFHGVVRELSGAAAHDRLVEHVMMAGFVRRSYLRGLASARCG
jgi:hypothetical protein